MRKSKTHLTLEKRILILKQRTEKGSISVQEILHVLSGKGQSLILLFLSLPFCQPLQIPGLSTPFGVIITFIGLRMAFGKRLWLPKHFLEKKINPHKMQKLTKKTLWLVKKIKRWVHPRLPSLCNYPAFHIINGLLIFILGVCLALPIPIPFTNLSVAWSIFFVGLGILEEDGVFVLIGYLISSIAITFFIAMLLSINLVI